MVTGPDIRFRRWPLLMGMGALILSVSAARSEEGLSEVLRGSGSAVAKLEAMERAAGNADLGKKDYEGLLETVEGELTRLVSAGDGSGALALWLRYLKALPPVKDSERFRRFPASLQAAVRTHQAKAESLFDQEDYRGAWRAAADIIEAGSDLEAARSLQRKASEAGALAARIDALWPRAGATLADPALAELERMTNELERLRAGASPSRRVKAVAALRQQLEAEPSEVLVGGISRQVQPPAATPRPVATVQATRPPTPSAKAGASPAPRPRSPTPRRPSEPEAPSPSPAAPAPVSPTAEPVHPLPPDVERRVREVARREATFYRRALKEAGAGPAVPWFRVEAVSIRERTAEIHLLAGLDDPAARVPALALPHADRQFLRLLAHKVLEETPEMAKVDLHLALQNGRSAPVDLGSVRIEAELLKLTAGQSVDAFWSRVDASGLESAWP
jgi:hypothetical protein